MIQQEALDILKLGHNVYLTGPPGSGKTFLLSQYIAYLKENHRTVAVTASTGIAATHMDGVTIHSWSGLGLKDTLTDLDLRGLLKKSYLRKRIKNTDILIIDEVSMIHAFQFDMLNRICQAFKNSFKPFGGMQVVCSGDFFQLPPVQKSGKPKFVVESEIWSKMGMKICYLTEQHRQKDDKLSALLTHIRNNAVIESRELLLNMDQEKSFSLDPIKLYTHNVDVDEINNLQLSKIGGEEFVYDMDSRGNENVIDILKRTCLAPERLVLKQGAKVMFVKNNFDEGYVNGTLGIVVGFDEDGLPIVKTFKGRTITAVPSGWRIEEEEKVKAEISQIPLRLAWAITVHKSQGMNLDAAEIDLSKCFLEGMGYVALSRLSTLTGLRLRGINNMALLVNQEVRKLDEVFKQLSQQVKTEVNKMSLREKRQKQRQFLAGVIGKVKQKTISTYLKTKALIAERLSLKEIARQRDLTENTVIGHLEKLAQSSEPPDLEYLRPSRYLLEQIAAAFQETGGDKLLPVQKILGDEFSYQEIRLARLFLKEN
ncbi:MAG: helix-turn-helix domain-containing protein [bacterium]